MNEIKCEERLPKEEILQYVQEMKLCQKQQEITIDRMGPDEFGNYYRERWSKLNDRYPGILNMFINDAAEGKVFDDKRLETMLTMLNMMRQNQQTEISTNIDVMTSLRDKYVLPVLGEDPSNFDAIDPEKYKDVDWNQSNIKFDQ